MRNALFAEEESTALSTWAVASICGCLRLEHVSIRLFHDIILS